MSLRLHFGAPFLPHEADADLHEIAHDLLHVAAHIADLREFRGLHLDEGRAGELGETTGNLRLADAGRTDHQDILGHDLVAQLVVELLAAPAVAQRNGNRALRVLLSDDVAVELRHDFPG